MKIDDIVNACVAVGALGIGMIITGNDLITNIGVGTVTGSGAILTMYGYHLSRYAQNPKMNIKMLEVKLYG